MKFDVKSPQYDTIRLCIHGITGGLSSTVKRMDPAATTTSIATEVAASSDTTVATSTNTAVDVDSEVRDTPGTAAPAAAAAAATATTTFIPAAISSSFVGSKQVPKHFGDGNAVDSLAIEVPKHIQARWKMIDAHMRIKELFGAENNTVKALTDVHLK